MANARRRSDPTRAVVVILLLAAYVSAAFGAYADPIDPHVRTLATARVARTERSLKPRWFTYYTSGKSWVVWNSGGWTSGYLPGELWMSYALTGDPWFRTHALSREAPLGATIPSANAIDIGMRYFYSYVSAYRLTGKTAYEKTALKAAKAQVKRYNAAVGAFRSTTSPSFQVIIDDLMNIQLLTWGADHGGPASWRTKAHRHALTTARDFVRADGSTFHIASYNPVTGSIEATQVRQGYSTSSTWSRGQAWAIYGFSAAYASTRDVTLLAAARKVADYYVSNLPADKIPYWDFDAPHVPNEPKDSSAAAIAASGLLDLAAVETDHANAVRYRTAAS